ncbi:hypothetical protein CPB84DRAFT_1761418 [Gymnopilus junonius]|uniref:Uncharacterized protein n=1 Tax=Gymnopilus junonius TaxID=109634 RepID=A0A9P5P1J8_GYMJU|nr:hypothetical protein CPB84DRAFT_1761418 [Gymnopilus junonius]
MPRWVLVDDTDAGIQYNGPWFVHQGSQNILGNFGIPYRSTLHGINTNGSFSYSFRGSRVLITATLEFPAPDGPFWQCIVDGVVIPSIVYTTPENRLRYCEEDGLAEDVQHNITVKASVQNQRTFWFDYIQYLPPVDEPLENVSISVDIPDPQMLFSNGWTLHAPGYMTSLLGSTFSFTFTGSSLTWFGFYDNSLPLAATTATYTIDGGKAVAFDLNGAAALRTGVQYNQIFFQTNSLPIGEHTLIVAYQGNLQTAPLTLSVVYIEDGTSYLSNSGSPIPSSSSFHSSLSVPALTTSGGSFTSTPFFPEPSAVKVGTAFSKLSPASEIGAIIGGILGGLTIISLLIVGLSQRYKKWRQSKRAQPEMAEVGPSFNQRTPIPLSTNSSTEVALVPELAHQRIGGDTHSHISEERNSVHNDIVEIPRNHER